MIRNLVYETLGWSRKWLLDFNAGKTKLVLFAQCNNTDAIAVKRDVSVPQEKSSVKVL